MACRGIFYAITSKETKHLLALIGDDDAMSDAANMLYSEEREASGFQAGVDKAWDAMHRCLGNGLLNDIGKGTTALSRFVLGGRNLYQGISYIICFLSAEEVKEVADAAESVTKKWMRDRYFKQVPQEFDRKWHEQDWEYTWSYFEATRKVFENARHAGRAIVFLTDQ